MRSSCAGPQAFHLRLSQIGRGRFRPVAREQRTFSVFAASRFHFSLASILLNGCGFPSYVAERVRLQCTRRKSPAGRIRRTFTGCVSCSACFHPTHARTHARTPALSHPCTHILTCSLARAHTHAVTRAKSAWACRCHSCSVDELYSVLDLTYPASLARMSERIRIDQGLAAHLEKLCPADVFDIAPEDQLAELLRKLSSYKDWHSGAARSAMIRSHFDDWHCIT